MSNKKLLLATACLFLLATVPVNASLSSIDKKAPEEKLGGVTEEQQVRINALKKRVAEIEAIDRSKLSKTDRIELRKELKDLKKKAKGDGRGFILALGGIVIVILLLVLLL